MVLSQASTVKVSKYRDQNHFLTLFAHNTLAVAKYYYDEKKVTVKELEAECKKLITTKPTAYKYLHSFVTSAKFKKDHNTNNRFVKAMYWLYLMRKPTYAERSSWVAKIAGGKSKTWVENGIRDSAECASVMKKVGLKVK